MNIRLEDLSAIRSLGYTETEARFLYLVATHSGYFTQRQYLDFSGQHHGFIVNRLTSRILTRHHARATAYAHKTHVYNLHSRRIYGAIDKDNLRNRRRQSVEMILTRLMILDFVLAHRDEHYLETETDKVDYFHRRMGLPLSILPARIYRGITSAATTARYFVDRFPVFIPASGNPLGLAPWVTFTYCHALGSSLESYVTHLKKYQGFLHHLPGFNLIFASAEAHQFDRARSIFTQLFRPAGFSTARRLTHYFEIRKLWDTHRTAELTHADRDFLRETMQEFKAQKYEAAYQEWAAGTLSAGQIQALVAGPVESPNRFFHTCTQPRSYPIFSTESSRDYRRPPRYR